MSVNTVLLVGRLGAAPELRSTASGKTLCTFNLATSYWDKRTQTEGVDWHRVVVWDKVAESCHRHLDKGSQVAIEGRLKHRSWVAEDGGKRYMTEVVASRVTFLTGRNAALGGGPRESALSAIRAPRQGPGSASVVDDIPF